MGEWIQCPGCALRHSARADGVCPRCHQPVAAFATPDAGAAALAPAPAAPAADARAEPSAFAGGPAAFGAPAPAPAAPTPGPTEASAAAAPGAEEHLPRAARVAGVLFVLVGMSNLVLFFLQGSHDTKMISSSIVDVLLGGALAIGTQRQGLKGFAIFRVVAGCAVFGIIAWKQAGPGAFAFQAILSAGLLLLLVGAPERGRLWAGAAVASIMVALNLAGVVGTAAGSNPIAEWFASANGFGDPVEEIQGSRVRWALTLPPDHWRPRSEEATAKDAPGVDRMIAWPAKDAAIVVVAQEIPGAHRLDLDLVANAVVEGMRKSSKRFEELASEPLATRLEAARVIHATSVMEGQPIEALYGVFVDGNVAITVIGAAPPRSFAELEEEFREILSSLRRPDGEV